MRNIYKITLALILMMAMFQAQAQKSNKGLMKKVYASKTKWEKLKKESKNSYTYVIARTSTLGAFTVRTYVTVKRGRVTKAYRTTQNFKKKNSSEGKRKKLSRKERKKLKTLDEIYAFAAEKLAKKSAKKNYISFKTFDNGLIKQAGFTPMNCADDCFEGYTIDKIDLK